MLQERKITGDGDDVWSAAAAAEACCYSVLKLKAV